MLSCIFLHCNPFIRHCINICKWLSRRRRTKRWLFYILYTYIDWAAESALSWLNVHKYVYKYSLHTGKGLCFESRNVMCSRQPLVIIAQCPVAHTRMSSLHKQCTASIFMTKRKCWLGRTTPGWSVASVTQNTRAIHTHTHTHCTLARTCIKQIPNGAQRMPVMPKGRRTRRKYLLAGRKYTFCLVCRRSLPGVWLQLAEQGYDSLKPKPCIIFCITYIHIRHYPFAQVVHSQKVPMCLPRLCSIHIICMWPCAKSIAQRQKTLYSYICSMHIMCFCVLSAIRRMDGVQSWARIHICYLCKVR